VGPWVQNYLARKYHGISKNWALFFQNLDVFFKRKVFFTFYSLLPDAGPPRDGLLGMCPLSPLNSLLGQISFEGLYINVKVIKFCKMAT